MSSESKIQVYAVLRVETDLPFELDDLGASITITSILPSLEEAKAEVDRLNTLNAQKQYRYFWQATRYYPTGRKGA